MQTATRRFAPALASVLVAAVFASPMMAQSGRLAGKVVDAVSNEPVAGALVRIAGTKAAALTASDGTFTIPGLPPAMYAVSARRFGFATKEVTRVEVPIAGTRTLRIALRPSLSDTTDHEVAPAATFDPGAIGTALAARSDQVSEMPTFSMSGWLAITGNYLDLPRSSATLSLSDLRRGVVSSASVRAGRPEATQYTLEGIDVTNPVFGSPPILLDAFGIAEVVFSPSYVGAESGNALSGAVNQIAREGTSKARGGFEYQTTAIAGTLGSATSAARGASVTRGFLAAPLPLGGDAFHFSMAGHLLRDRTTVARPVQTRATGPVDDAWRGRGDHEDSQLAGKLTYAVGASTRLSLTGVAQGNEAVDLDPGIVVADSVAPESMHSRTRLVVARIDRRFSRGNFSVALGRTSGSRQTCSIWQGVCIADRLYRYPVGAEVPIVIPPRLTPYGTSGQYFGGETYTTDAARGDIAVQLTDHNELKAGVSLSSHRIAYRDAIGGRWLQGVMAVTRDVYRARPMQFASYVQSAITYDLLAIHVGGRFEHGHTGGVAFVNPLDPNNGTTAVEVCDGRAPGINTIPFTYGGYTGFDACIFSPAGVGERAVLLDSAARLAQQDDLRAVRARGTFLPRIALSFPLTERSTVFANFGRYGRPALYHDAFRHSGTGSRAGLDEGGDNVCDASLTRPGTNECLPNLLLDPLLPEFLGNPNLSPQQATSWEAGFAVQLDRGRSVNAVAFSNEQSYLPSVIVTPLGTDVGLTYGVLSRGAQRMVVSHGSVSSFGVAATVRQNTTGPMSYAVTYSWQRTSELGARPDLVAEALAAGEPYNDAVDRLSSRNHPHAVNAMVRLQWRNETPPGLGRFGSAILRNSQSVVTVSAFSASQSATLGQAGCPGGSQGCAAYADRTSGTGGLVNVLYVRSIQARGFRWALIGRVMNAFDERDGAGELRVLRRQTGAVARPIERTSSRRIFTGISLSF